MRDMHAQVGPYRVDRIPESPEWLVRLYEATADRDWAYAKAYLYAWGLVALLIRRRTAFIQRRSRSQWILAAGSTLSSALVVAGVLVPGLLYWRL
jgi:hypothetical protein